MKIREYQLEAQETDQVPGTRKDEDRPASWSRCSGSREKQGRCSPNTRSGFARDLVSDFQGSGR